MAVKSEESALIDLLQNLQVHIHAAYRTQCPATWRELDYVPSYNKLYYIRGGEGWLKVGDTELHPKPGQLCIMPTHVKQSYSALPGKTPFFKDWCHFNVYAGPFDLFQWIDVPLVIEVPDAERMDRLFEDLISGWEQRTVASLLREKAAMLEIVSMYLGQVPVRILKNRGEEMNRIGVIQTYVENHLNEPFSVEDMASALHLHPNYFITYFKKRFGIPPHRYMNRKRVERAKTLLTTTTLSIKEIADQTGISDTNHFAKFFRKETGCSPTVYRAIHS